MLVFPILSIPYELKIFSLRPVETINHNPILLITCWHTGCLASSKTGLSNALRDSKNYFNIAASKLTPPFAEPLEHELNGKTTNEIVLLKKLNRLEWWLGKLGFIKNFSWDLTLYLQSQTSWGNKCATERGKTLFFDYLYSAYATWARNIFSPPNRYSCCRAEFRSIFSLVVRLAGHTAERYSSTKRARETAELSRNWTQLPLHFVCRGRDSESDVAAAVFEMLLCCWTTSPISSQ